ncbi:unnamed protein product, partial [Prorocentrum cordatum]
GPDGRPATVPSAMLQQALGLAESLADCRLSRGRGPQSSGPGPPRIGRSRAALAARTPLLAARYREAAAHGEACQALLREELGDSDPRLCDAGPMSLPRRALGLVLTRSFVLSTPGGQSSVAMLPLLDLLNHADGDGVRTPRRTCFCVQEGGSVLMVAERDISPGEEVTHAYSEAASDHGLLCQYGVAPPADGDAAGGRGEAGLFDGPKPSTFRSAWDIWGAPDTASPSRDRGIASPFSAGGQRNGPADV